MGAFYFKDYILYFSLHYFDPSYTFIVHIKKPFANKYVSE